MGLSARPLPSEYENDTPGFHRAHQAAGYYQDGRCAICFPMSQDYGPDVNQPNPNPPLDEYPKPPTDTTSVKLVRDLETEMDRVFGGRRFFDQVVAGEKMGRYGLVAVMNAGDGPDEQWIGVVAIEWDHDMGQLRLILE